MFSLKPKDHKCFNLFHRGTEISHKSAVKLRELLDTLENPKDILKELTDLEHQGDSITHELMDYTNNMFITPLDREDIFSITKGIDTVTDNIEATAYKFYMHHIDFSTDISKQIADKLVEATEHLIVVIEELKYHHKSEIMIQKIIDINTIENEADQLYRNAVRELYNNSSDILNLMKWEAAYKYLEDSIDACEKLANEIRGVVMKYA